jgi:hypothetical protein
MRGVFGIVAVVCTSQLAAAQPAALRIRLSGNASERLAGALIALLDSAGSVKTEVLSSSDGRATLRAEPGSYRVRVRRIGFQPFVSGPITLPRESELVLPVQSARVVLATVVVSAKAECGTVGEEAAKLAGVWEEIAKALRASQLTSADISAIGRFAVYVREIDSRGVVLVADTIYAAASRGRPFGSVDPTSLVKDGYVRGNEAKGWEYFGPDEAVLLSRGFAETHCFRVVRDDKRTGEIGLAFEPSSSRKLSDIMGVLWLDESSSELREMNFQYVNADIVSRFKPSGFTRFRRMPSGAWIVSEWRVRMPKLSRRAGSWQNDLIGYIEKGGRIAGTPPG